MPILTTSELRRRVRVRTNVLQEYLRGVGSPHVRRVRTADEQDPESGDTQWCISEEGIRSMREYFRLRTDARAAEPWRVDVQRRDLAEMLPNASADAPADVWFDNGLSGRRVLEIPEGSVFVRGADDHHAAWALFEAVGRRIVRSVCFSNDVGLGHHMRAAFETLCAGAGVEVSYYRSAEPEEIATDLLRARADEVGALMRMRGLSPDRVVVHDDGRVEGPGVTRERADRVRQSLSEDVSRKRAHTEPTAPADAEAAARKRVRGGADASTGRSEKAVEHAGRGAS